MLARRPVAALRHALRGKLRSWSLRASSAILPFLLAPLLGGLLRVPAATPSIRLASTSYRDRQRRCLCMTTGVFNVTRQDRKFFLVRVLVLLTFCEILFTVPMEGMSRDRNFFLENIVVLLTYLEMSILVMTAPSPRPISTRGR